MFAINVRQVCGGVDRRVKKLELCFVQPGINSVDSINGTSYKSTKYQLLLSWVKLMSFSKTAHRRFVRATQSN